MAKSSRIELQVLASSGEVKTNWNDNFPPNWRVTTLGRSTTVQLSSVDKLTLAGEQPVRLCNYVDVYKNDFITSGISFMSATANAAEIARFSLQPGDVLLTKDSESWNDIGVPAVVTENLPGVVCGYHLALVRPNLTMADGRYLFWALTSTEVAQQFHQAANGVTRFGIPKQEIRDIEVPLPPLDEQRAIARFLDRKSRRIARFIQARQRMIALLNEQKRAIIHRAVTRGLDPDVPLKPSGIDWLGDIPAHWSLVPSGRVMTEVSQGWSPVAGDDEDNVSQWSVLTLSAVKAGKFYPDARKPIPSTFATRPDLEIKAGDVFLTRANTRQLVGDVAVVESTPPRLIFSDLIYRVQLDQSLILAPYFVSLMKSRVGRDYIEREARASNESMVKLAASRLRNWSLPIPPLQEQQAIESALESMGAEIETTIGKSRREIELVREYRTRLIADVVTGKLDIHDHPDAAEDAPEDLDAMSDALDGILVGDTVVGDMEDDGTVDEAAV